MKKLTEHFTLEEMIRSEYAIRKGIDNTPLSEEENNLKDTCYMLEDLRHLLGGKQIHVTSGYRSPLVNKGIGGAKNSQHTKGQAADIHVDGMSTEELYQFIKCSNIDFDQCIQEFDSWVHLSYSHENRKQFLRATKNNGRVIYAIDQ